MSAEKTYRDGLLRAVKWLDQVRVKVESSDDCCDEAVCEALADVARALRAEAEAPPLSVETTGGETRKVTPLMHWLPSISEGSRVVRHDELDYNLPSWCANKAHSHRPHIDNGDCTPTHPQGAARCDGSGWIQGPRAKELYPGPSPTQPAPMLEEAAELVQRGKPVKAGVHVVGCNCLACASEDFLRRYDASHPTGKPIEPGRCETCGGMGHQQINVGQGLRFVPCPACTPTKETGK